MHANTFPVLPSLRPVQTARFSFVPQCSQREQSVPSPTGCSASERETDSLLTVPHPLAHLCYVVGNFKQPSSGLSGAKMLCAEPPLYQSPPAEQLKITSRHKQPRNQTLGGGALPLSAPAATWGLRPFSFDFRGIQEVHRRKIISVLLNSKR